MRKLSVVLGVLWMGCGGAGADAALQPTAEPLTAPPTSAPETSAAPGVSATPTADPSANAPELENDASIETATAEEVKYTSGAGQTLTVRALSYGKFARRMEGLPSSEVPSATVRFATMEADGAKATDISCALPPWPPLEGDAAAKTAALLGLAVQDAAATAAVLAAKKELLACAKGAPLRLVWSFRDSHVTQANADGVDAACLTKALAKSPAFNTGKCVATIAP